MEGMEVMESGRSNAVASSVGESEEDTRSRRTHPTFKSLREMKCRAWIVLQSTITAEAHNRHHGSSLASQPVNERSRVSVFTKDYIQAVFDPRPSYHLSSTIRHNARQAPDHG